MYKIISFDIDGTLYSYSRENFGISNSTLQMLKTLSRSYILVLNSGRAFEDIPQSIQKYFTYFIMNNGSAVYDRFENLIWSKPIPKVQIESMINQLSQQNKNFILKTLRNTHFYCVDGHMPDYMRLNNEVNYKLEKLDTNRTDVYCVNTVLSREELREFQQVYPDLEFTHGGFNYYEIYVQKTNKWKALEYVLMKNQIHASECMAFGDSMNDFEILNHVGLGVAMKDGSQELLDRIFVVCDSIDENGIQKFLEEKNLM